MRGHIRQRSKGSWEIAVDLGKDPETGKRRQQFQTVKGTKKDAERELRKLLNQIESGGYVKPSRLTVAAYLEQWLTDYATAHTNLRTQHGYRRVVALYLTPYVGNLSLEKLTAQHVQGLYARLLNKGLAARTVIYAHRVLREALDHAVKWGLLARNVADAVDPPRPKAKEMHILDPQGIKRFLEAGKDSPYLPVFTLALFTGMRRGELLGLRWQDVDLEGAAISITQALQRVPRKGLLIVPPKSARSRRRVALPPEMVEMLRGHRARQLEARLAAGPVWEEGGWVFCGPAGRYLDPDNVSHVFGRIAKAAGLTGVRLHDLRHTHASLMLAQGVHPKIVSERLGHASITITLDTYSHVLPGLQEAAARTFAAGLKGMLPLAGGDAN